MTPSKQVLIQFFLDNRNRHIPFKQVQEHVMSTLPGVDRTTVYRNLEKFIQIGVIQELDLPIKGKVYQFIFEKKVHHYYICKACGKVNKGDEDLFAKIEKALRDIHDFSKANLSVVFYGLCSKCEARSEYGVSHGA
jgi:Fur family ferric uptake transcriptional regulator